MENYFGIKYILQSRENFAEYMNEVGMRASYRDIALKRRPKKEFNKVENGYTLIETSEDEEFFTIFQPGMQFEKITADGRRIRSIFTLREHTLIERQITEDGIVVLIERIFNTEKLQVIYIVNETISTNIFKRYFENLNYEKVIGYNLGQNVSRGTYELESFLNNVYKLESSHNFEKILEALGISEPTRSVINHLRQQVCLKKVDNQFVFITESKIQNTRVSFIPDVTFDSFSMDGRSIKTCFNIIGPKLIEKQVDEQGREIIIERHFMERSMRCMVYLDDIKSRRIFQLLSDEDNEKNVTYLNSSETFNY